MARPRKNTNTQALADKMRKAVLQAAIEGKLTEQNPTEDGHARDLLADIEAEKQRLIKAGEIKRQKSLPPITEEDQPFDIPDNWEWVRLGEIVIVNPRNKTEDNLEAAFIPMTLIKDGYDNSVTFEVRKWEKIKKGYTHFAKNDVVLAKITPCFQNLKSAIIPDIPNGIGAGTTEIHVLRSFDHHIDLDYLLYFVKNPKFINDGVATFTGTAGQQRVGTDFIKEYLFPLPPLAEQHRIVAKLQDVMPQLDSLQADEDALHALQTTFPNQMQASLLQAAIEGKLTQQDATTDGNAHDLLADIQAEKQRLIKTGEVKRQKTLPPIIEEEKPFDIPDNWEWVRLGELTYNRGQKKPDKKFSYIDIASIDNKTQRLNSELDTISPSEAPSRARKIVSKGDIIYATVRPYLMNITIIDRDIEPEPIVSTGFAVLTTPYEVTNKYLFRVLMSPHFDSYANHNDNAKGVAYPAINDSRLMNGIIPLPPLAEQQRIVDLLKEALPEIQTLKDIQQ